MIQHIAAFADWRLVYNPVGFIRAARAQARDLEELADRNPEVSVLRERGGRLYNTMVAMVIVWGGLAVIAMRIFPS